MSSFTQPLSFSQSASASRSQPRRSVAKSAVRERRIGGTPLGSGSNESGASWVDSWSRVAGSFKRSVASSPTESGPTSTSPKPAAAYRGSPTSVVVGFDVPCVIPGVSPKPTSSNAGLLSKQLSFVPGSQDNAFLLSPVSEASGNPSPFSRDLSSSFFPDVDTTLLHNAQERHEIFKSELVSNAFGLASRAYRGQIRKDGTSQLSHCVLAALTLADLGLDEGTVAAGLLHEALRNNEALRSQLEEFMPSEVVRMVDRVTTISEISQLYRNHRDEVSDEKLRRMMLAMEDVKTVLVKLACRVHNMKTLSALSPEKQRLFAQETLDIFAVVANRLGCWCLKAELEDLSFSVLYPEEHARVAALVRSRQDPAALEAMVGTVKAGLEARGIQYEDISGRPKNLYGLWQKMQRDGVQDVDKIYDVIALRVVVSGNKHDCYVAQRAVQQLFRTMPERSKDFIRDIKKANGYQSLHETVLIKSSEEEEDGGEGALLPVEVQIRTSKMHYIAEYGFAAHWKYKESGGGSDTEALQSDEWLDREVQYKKWLMSYGLGVHDRKVRPVGSPPTDSSLKSLGAAYLKPSAAAAASSSASMGRSSTPAPTVYSPSKASSSSRGGGNDDARVDPFLRHDRFRLQQPAPRPVVTVMLQTQDMAAAPHEFAAGKTAGQLAHELGVGALPGGYVLTVNHRVIVSSPELTTASSPTASPSTGNNSNMRLLQDGDLVQVLPLSQLNRGSNNIVAAPMFKSSSSKGLLSRALLAGGGDGAVIAAVPAACAATAFPAVFPAPSAGFLEGLDVFSMHSAPVSLRMGASVVSSAPAVPILGA